MLRDVILILFALLLGASSALADPPAGYDFTEFSAGLARARTENKPVLVYFGRYGCAWCEHTNRKTFADPEIKRVYGENYVLVYVDAEGGKRLRLPNGERLTEAEYGARLGAYATPLFVFLAPDGRQVAKVPGYKTVADFLAFDRYVRGRHYETRTLADFLKGQP